MENSREHILSVAANLFLQKSYRDVTMKEIVQKSGMSKGAFYHYFTSKEELFQEIVKKFMQIGNIDYEKFPHDSLFSFIQQYLNMLYRNNPILEYWFKGEANTSNINFFILMFDAIERVPGFREQTHTMHEREQEAWTAIIAKARANGEINSPMSDEHIALIFTLMTDGLFLHSILDGRTDLVRDQVKELFNNFYEQIKT